jgi:hypothetical protein
VSIILTTLFKNIATAKNLASKPMKPH